MSTAGYVASIFGDSIPQGGEKVTNPYAAIRSPARCWRACSSFNSDALSRTPFTRTVRRQPDAEIKEDTCSHISAMRVPPKRIAESPHVQYIVRRQHAMITQ